jgi:uncharacterized membrane protein
MRPSSLTDPQPVLKSLLGLLACVVLAAIVSNYPRYLPPDFTSDFLLGRADSFFGAYCWAFYAHLAAGPVTLLLGLALLSDRLRRRHPAWHRVLGVSWLLPLAACEAWRVTRRG